jgi:ABC-2 type transport system permease protein
MLKAEPITALWIPIVVLLAMATAVLGLAVLRFRRDLAPSARRHSEEESEPLVTAA